MFNAPVQQRKIVTPMNIAGQSTRQKSFNNTKLAGNSSNIKGFKQPLFSKKAK